MNATDVALPMFTRPEVAPLPRGVCPGCGGVAVLEDFDSYAPGGQAVRKRIYRCQLRPKLRCPAVTEIIGTETKVVPLASPELKSRFNRIPFAKKDKINRVASLSGLESQSVRSLLVYNTKTTPEKIEKIEEAVSVLEQEMAVLEKRSEELAAVKAPAPEPDPAPIEPPPAPQTESPAAAAVEVPAYMTESTWPEKEGCPVQAHRRAELEAAATPTPKCDQALRDSESQGWQELVAQTRPIPVGVPRKQPVEQLTPTINHIQMANTLHVAKTLATLPRAAWEYALQLAELELQKRELEARIVSFFLPANLKFSQQGAADET